MMNEVIRTLERKEVVTQTELQDTVPIVFDSVHALLLEWVTGIGKGRAIMCACEHMEKVLFVVEKLNQIQNFKNDCEKHGFSYDQYTFTHYNSLKKYVGIQYDCVVLNEADSISDNVRNVLSTLSFHKLLLAAAMFPLPKKIEFWNDVCKFQTWKVNLAQANKWGILPEPKVYLHLVEPSNNSYSTFTVTKSKNYKEVIVYTYDQFVENRGRNLNITCNVNDNEALKIINDLVTYYRDEANEKGWGTKTKLSYAGLQTMLYGSMRKKILGKIKFQKIHELSLSLQGRKIIFVNDLEAVNGITIYSKNGKKINEENLRMFNENEVNELYAIKMVNRDMNLVDTKIALVGDIGNNPVELVQRIGRALRHRDPEIHIVCVKDEKDHKLFQKQVKKYTIA